MKTFILLILLFFISGADCLAEPDLDVYDDIDGARVYQDHKNRSVWYISPARPVLNSRQDKTPDYGLSLYRYLGRKGTGDSGSFWVKGVLTFGFDRSGDQGITGKIRKALSVKGINSPRLKSMPVSASRVSLLFANQVQVRENNLRWKTGAMVVPLDKDNAEILWGAVEKGQVLVSVAFEETLAGVVKKEDEWQPETTSLTWTIPVEMDMNAHPDHFSKMDLGGRMKVGYTGLDVFCFDFIENLEENLYAKIVEVAIPTSGRDLVETITFKEEGDYRDRIEFKLAKNLDQPYRYRIIRIYNDGSQKSSTWLEKTGEALLDITSYKNIDDTDHESANESYNP
ncbi:MAG: hypothetical protein JXL81_09035 [Deltaproteobacteria bacterium]|nr:hypothetical protein [Deltaproteobacteria bacterium]